MAARELFFPRGPTHCSKHPILLDNAVRRTWGSYQGLEQLKLIKFQGGSSIDPDLQDAARLSSGPRYIKDRLTCGELASD